MSIYTCSQPLPSTAAGMSRAKMSASASAGSTPRAHRAKGVQNEFERFSVSADWREDAETSFLGDAMLGFRFMVEEMQRAALR